MPSTDRSPTPARPPGPPPTPPGWRGILTPAAIARLVLGWGAVAALAALGPALDQPLPGYVLLGALAAIVAIIVVCAFGVVHEAEALAARLGDPYGTLVLTLSIVVIEVILIAAVLLGPGDHTTIARDSVMAVSMIILNLVLGVCLLAAGVRYGKLPVNRVGASTYVVLLIVLVSTAFALPAAIGDDGAFTAAQAVPVIVLTVGLYGFFLWRQTTAQAEDFREVNAATTGPDEDSRAAGGPDAAGPHDSGPGTSAGARSAAASARSSITAVIARHRTELLARTAVLVATVLPIVLLSHDMATLLDEGLSRLGAPVALSGLLIAMIVFTPETITAIRAAWGAEMQRVVNLCHGALVSTFALTIPTVLVIAQLTGQQVVFAETPANLLLIGVTLAVTAVGASAPRTTAVNGAAHLMLFGIYVLVLFS